MQLMTDLVPASGHTCLVFIPSKESRGGITHVWGDLHNPAFVESTMERFERKHFNAYFAVSSFVAEGTDGHNKKDSGREKELVASCKSLWLDIDAGPEKYKKHPDKVYFDQGAALDAIYAWLERFRLPFPTYLISSGYGVHLYWALTEEVTPKEWAYASACLVAVAREAGIKVDSGASSNVAGLMRLPGSWHVTAKDRCRVIEQGKIIDYDFFVGELLECLPEDFKPNTGTKTSTAIDTGLLGAKPSFLADTSSSDWAVTAGGRVASFQALLKRSLRNDKARGCEQIRQAWDDPSSIEYDQWRAVLSITMNCDEGEYWAHKVFAKSDKYDESYTDSKLAELIDKPYRCEAFDRCNGGVCTKCPFWEKISSPIQLAYTVEQETDLRTEVAVIEGHGNESVSVYDMKPQLDWPYFWRKNGGLWMYVDGEDDVEDSVEVLRTDLWISRLVQDPEVGQVAVLLSQPVRRKTEQLMVPLAALHKDEKIIEVLGYHGIIPAKKMRATLMSFLLKSAQKAVDTMDLQATHELFGWTEDMRHFVLGNVVYGSDGKGRTTMTTPVLGARPTPLVPALTPPEKASVDAWAQAADMYSNRGMESGQFLLCMSLAAPLFELTGTPAALVHCFSTASGRGKTTGAQMALSIWGCPVNNTNYPGVGGVNNDTENATVARMGTLNSMPTSVDEITTRPFDVMARFVYSFTDGREKARLNQDAQVKTNVGRWTAPTITTGNESLIQKLSMQSSTGEALLARVVELDFGSTASLVDLGYSKQGVSSLFSDAMRKHHSVVGHHFIHWLFRDGNIEQAERLWKRTVEDCDKWFNFTQVERFWQGVVVSAVAGLRLGTQMRIWNFDEDRLLDYIEDQLNRARGSAKRITEERDDSVMTFLLSVVDKTVVSHSNGGMIRGHLRDSCAVRLDKGEEVIAISISALKKWCRETKTNFSDMEIWFRKHKAVEKRYHLMKGTEHDTGKNSRVSCWVIPLAEMGGYDITPSEDETK